jgi:hypothetical protein
MSMRRNRLWMYTVVQGWAIHEVISYRLNILASECVEIPVTNRLPMAMTWGTDKPQWFKTVFNWRANQQ